MSTFGDGMEKNPRLTPGIMDGFHREVAWIEDGSEGRGGRGIFDELSAVIYIQPRQQFSASGSVVQPHPPSAEAQNRTLPHRQGYSGSML